MTKLRVLSLFAGIGGFDLGLGRTGGFETVAFCEIDPFCRRVLAKHWPKVPCYEDVRELTAERLRADGISVDVICGGFPCQDISGAGLKAGIAGERSGLWADFERLIREIRPSYVLVENVADLLHRGVGRVLGDLAALGYDAEWHAIPICAVGGPHERDRLWIVAYPAIVGRGQGRSWRPYPSAARQQNEQQPQAPAYPAPMLRRSLLWQQQDRALREHWTTDWQSYAEALRGMDDGVSGRVDGLAALGNSLSPWIPELLGRAILASLEQQREAA
jgi:DNA (cytosine-5)-methyltransferase 1